jgi:hypothetical protein
MTKLIDRLLMGAAWLVIEHVALEQLYRWIAL